MGEVVEAPPVARMRARKVVMAESVVHAVPAVAPVAATMATCRSLPVKAGDV